MQLLRRPIRVHFGQRSVDPGELSVADSEDLLARDDAHDFRSAHAALPMAAVTAAHSLARSFSGS